MKTKESLNSLESFNVAVGDANFRPHHKATSFPNNWENLMELLESGLLLAKSGNAFHPEKI
jgi:hypothetical protein